MAYEQKNNEGILFQNNYKKSDKHPDKKGTCTINDIKYEIAGWVNQKGNITLRFQEQNKEQIKETKEINNSTIEEINSDDLPF